MEEVDGPEGIIAQVLQPEAGVTGDKDSTTATAAGTIGFLVALTPEGPLNELQQPTVTKVSPDLGPATGETPVTITGTNLAGASAVKFGPTEAASFEVVSEDEIKATSPAGTGAWKCG